MDRRLLGTIAVLLLVVMAVGAYRCACRAPPRPVWEGFEDGRELLVTFWKMDTCPHCTEFQPIFEAIKAEWEPRGVRFVVNSDTDEAKQNGVYSFPTLQFTKPDGEVMAYEGPRTEEALSQKIRELSG